MHTIVDNHIMLKIREWVRNEMYILARIYVFRKESQRQSFRVDSSRSFTIAYCYTIIFSNVSSSAQ